MNSTPIFQKLHDLNRLVEEQRFAEYWQSGIDLVCEAADAPAARLYLFESLHTFGNKVWQRGHMPTFVLQQIEHWEHTVAVAQTHPPKRLAMGGEYAVLHIQLVVDSVLRGVFSLVFEQEDAQAIPQSEQAALQELSCFVFNSGLRAHYLLDAQEKFERVNLLYMITQDLTGTLELTSVLNQTTYMAASMLNAQASTLYRVDAETNELIFMITKGEAAHILEEKRMPINQGVAGWVATHGESLIVNDAAASPLFDASVDMQTGFTTRSILCVPLRIQERTVGVLEVMNKENSHGFTEDDKEWLSVIGRQVAISLENARLFTREQEKVSELATLSEVSQTINSELDVSIILDKITHSILEILAADRSELLLVGDRSDCLELRSSAGYGEREDGETRYIQLDEDVATWCTRYQDAYNKPSFASNVASFPWADLPELQQSTGIMVPLTHRENIIGIIVVYSLTRQYFEGEKRALLQTFANQAAIAIQNAKLYQNLRAEQERIIKAQEEVRHQLARELHDNTAQMLALIIMNLDMVRQALQSGRIEHSLGEIDQLEELARQANREVRTLLFELRPIILESRGLIPALEAYVRQLSASLECDLHLQAFPLQFQINLKAANAIFSIVQEAVNNIRKHASASNVWIRVHHDEESLYFEVEDDGAGFNLDETMKQYDLNSSFGLLNMRERASLLGGKLHILSPAPQSEKGTLIRGAIPLYKVRHQDSPTSNQPPDLWRDRAA